MILNCRFAKSLIWITVYHILILLILPQDFSQCYASETNTTTKRVRQREYLRGGDQPIITTTIATSSWKPVKRTTAIISKFFTRVIELDDSPSPDETEMKNITTTTEKPEVVPDWDEQKWQPPCVMKSTVNQTGVIIFLHGLGSSGTGWGYSLAHVRDPHIKLICPTAKKLLIQHDMGRELTTSWFDEGDNTTEDNPYILKSTAYIHKLIDDEIKNGTPPGRIILAGFSQGGALALHAALTFHKRLAGIVAMSAWLPAADIVASKFGEFNSDIPILLGHGGKDEIVPHDIGYFTSKELRKISNNVEFKTYENAVHLLSGDGLDDMKSFFQKHLKPI